MSQKQEEKEIEYTQAMKSTAHLLVVRRSLSVAVASALAFITSNPKLPLRDYVSLARQRVELEIGILVTQEKILEKMAFQMNHREVTMTLFDLMDTDASGTIDLEELAEGQYNSNLV